MSEMIGKVARAIAHADGKADFTGQHDREAYESLARAAIEAMLLSLPKHLRDSVQKATGLTGDHADHR